MFKIITNNFTKYYKNKECTILHREDGSAIEYKNGTKHWYINGKRHQEDGPAIEWHNGNKHWYFDHKLHRVNGPAIEYANGRKDWYLNGKLHREDGPAIEFDDGYYRRWFLNNKEFFNVHSNEHWIDFTKSLILL